VAGGLYIYRWGRNDRLPEGTHELGDYSGDFRATANFQLPEETDQACPPAM